MVLLLAACGGSFEAEPPVVQFELQGAHASLDCTECHGPEPFGTLPTSCVSCHEEDRKAPDHFAGRTCNDGEGCHAADALAWNEALDHSFFPLEGAHAQPCEACHASPKGGPDLNGQAELCWNCHEDTDRPEGHYAHPDDPLDPLFRWDCAPCHSTEGNWTSPFPIFHSVRVPHGAVITDLGGCGEGPPEAWVTACVDCHPDGTDSVACLTCHATAHETAPNLREDETACTEACHVSGGPDRVGEACDSLPD